MSGMPRWTGVLVAVRIASSFWFAAAMVVSIAAPRPASRLRLVEPGTGELSVQRVDVLGGLIHEYRRAA